jgi:MoaA/NifB/PqqE/SkfB family radical SAM enzyme
MDTAYDLLIRKLTKQASATNIPLNGTFELTARCNLNCRMCYIHNQSDDCALIGRELTAKQWTSLAAEARDAGMLNLLLTGGEVFLRKDFREIYESLAKMGLKITIYTNGSLIDTDTAKWLGRIPPAAMEITLYGASPETYGRLCGNAQAYAQTMKAVDLLLEEGINLELKTTVVRDNVADFPALADFTYKRGKPLNIVEYLYPFRNTTCISQDQRLSPEEMIAFKQVFYKKSFELVEKYSPEDTKTGFNEQKNGFFYNTDKREESSRSGRDGAFRCYAGCTDFWMTWDGHITPCGMMTDVVQYTMETGFLSSWKELVNQCNQIPECKECKECGIRDYCESCPAKLKAEAGCYDCPAEYLCKSAKLAKELSIKGVQN